MIAVRGLRRAYELGGRRVEALCVAARCDRRVPVDGGLIVGDESREVAVG